MRAIAAAATAVAANTLARTVTHNIFTIFRLRVLCMVRRVIYYHRERMTLVQLLPPASIFVSLCVCERVYGYVISDKIVRKKRLPPSAILLHN